MGGRSSKQSAERKLLLQQAQDNLINERIHSIQSIREQLSNSIGETAIILSNQQQKIVSCFNRYMQTTLNIVEQQLLRKKKPLIKADLVAIIISLRPSYAQYIDDLQDNFTVEDLNLLIRSIVYDPRFQMEQQQQLQQYLQKENSNQLIEQQFQLIEQIKK